MQCVVIEKDGKTKPPNYTIPFNENSIRALSKKNRVYVLREFLFRNYSSCLTPRSAILDVAGGKGDLSWLLRNIDGINSFIADPRTPNHRRLVKSVQFLLDHPEEANVRAVEGLPTHQPLAKLIPRLLANNNQSRGVERSNATTNEPCGDVAGNENVELVSPNFMRIHVDNALVQALQKTLLKPPAKEEDAFRVWDEYWKEEQCRIESNKIYYGGTSPKKATEATNNIIESSQITDSRLALEMFQSLDCVVGFHPDQATEASIDLALLLNVPFAVVPW